MSKQNEGPTMTFLAGADVEQFDCVRLAAASTVTKTGGVASEDNTFIGVAQNAASSGEPVAVRMVNCVASSKVRVTSAVTAGAKVYTMADGEVDDVTTSLTVVGVALETADAANEIIEVAHIRGGNDDIS